MKKVLLLSLGLVMGLGAFAQERAAKKELSAPVKMTVKHEVFGKDIVETSAPNFVLKGTQSVVTNKPQLYYEAEAMYTTYDLQSNNYIANRMYQAKDGSVAVVATMSNEEYDDTHPDRGTGYNFAKEGVMANWGDIPAARIEEERTGWPSIAPYGPEGEILVNHADGLSYWIREKAGEGEWDGPHAIPNPTVDEFPEIDEGMKLAWARIATTGENNDVLHIFAAAQSDKKLAHFYVRSADLETFDIQYAPVQQDELHLFSFEEYTSYSYYAADDYAVSANGDNIAVVYCSGAFTNVMLYESNDAGLTWNDGRIVWECPTHGLDWETDEATIFGYLYAPTHATVAIGADGVSHVALGTVCISHGELGGSYSIYPSIVSDGVAYWNDTTCWDLNDDNEPVPSPIRALQGSEDSLNHHALRLWWDDPENENSIVMDIRNFCAWMPPYYTPDGYGSYNEFSYEKLYTGSAEGIAGDYLQRFGVTAYPSIAVDPAGNLAIAYSSPDMNRELYDNSFYYRSLYANYKPVDSAYWSQMPLYAVNLYEDFIHTSSEATYVSAVSTPVNENEFWFSAFADDTPGFYTSGGSQTSITTSNVDVFKFNPTLQEWNEESIEESIDVVYNIFPNPATDYVNISSSSDAVATVTFANIAGQTVKVLNTNLTTGHNTISISDLTTGVYFCTVTANGYSHTSKVVVK